MRVLRLALTGVLVAVLVLTTIAPAFAATDSAQSAVQVQFQNKTGASVRITLTGPTTLFLSLSTGKTKAELIPGTYTYSYLACGKTITGVFKVKKAGDTLTLPKCKWESNAGTSSSDKFQVQFDNKTGASVRITLTGPATVYLTLNTGKTKSELSPGTYKYSYSACGKTNDGTFKVKKAGDILVLPKCKTGGGGGGGGEGKIKIKNSTGGTITIIMTGPQSYTFYVSTGSSQLSVVKGKYNYTAYGCGGASTSGSIKPGGVITFWCY